MKITAEKLFKPLIAISICSVILFSCTATIKVPKHPAPGEPPKAPKVEIHNN